MNHQRSSLLIDIYIHTYIMYVCMYLQQTGLVIRFRFRFRCALVIIFSVESKRLEQVAVGVKELVLELDPMETERVQEAF